MSYIADQSNLTLLKKIYAEKTQRTVFFLGAGASAEAGLPTWFALREGLHSAISLKVNGHSDDQELENFRELEEIKDTNNYWKYFDFSAKKWTTTYNDFLEEKFDFGWDRVETPIIYKKIWEMEGANQVVTLNVDGLLQKAFGEVNRTKNGVLVQYDGYSVTDSKPYFSRGVYCLLNLHGTVFHKSRWIMNESERRRLYEGESKKKYVSFLTWLFQSHNIVFVGLNPKDIAVSQFLDLASESGILEKHFWICPSPDGETKRWAEQNSIRLIEYVPEAEAEVDGVSVHSSDICSILDDVERHVSQDPPVTLPVSVPECDPANREGVGELIQLLTTKRDLGIKKLSGYAEFVGNRHGYSSANLNKLIEDLSLPIQFAASLDAKVAPFNAVLDYTIIDKIQGSGSSSVWMCEDKNNKNEYLVIKSLNGTNHSDEIERQSFRRGIESMYLLQKSELDVAPKYVFHLELPLSVIMEYIPGTNLFDVVREGVLNNNFEKLKVFENICRAVRLCHLSEGNVLHRDIKPGNVIFKDWFSGYDVEDLISSSIRLINFDLSWHRYSSGNTKSISADEVGYYAPEQKASRNSPPPRTAQTDVYMLGMLLYYIISEENPPEGGARLVDWKDLVSRSILKNFSSPIIRQRLIRLMLSMTEVELDSRIDVEAVLANIRNIFEFNSGNYGNIDYDFLVENLMSGFSRTYSWDSEKMEGTLHTTLNAFLKIRYIPHGMKCEISFSRSREESANRASFGGQINKRIQEIRQTLTDAGWNCELGGGVIKTLRADIPVRVLARKIHLGKEEMDILAERLLSNFG